MTAAQLLEMFAMLQPQLDIVIGVKQRDDDKQSERKIYQTYKSYEWIYNN